MRNKTILKALALVVLLQAFCFHSFAQIRTFCVKGVVLAMDDLDSVLNGIISVGDSISGTVKYDLSLPDSNPLSGVADYRDSIPDVGFHLTIGNQVFKTDTGNVDFLVEPVDNYGGRDGIGLGSYNNVYALPFPAQYQDNFIKWKLLDGTQTAISTTAIFNSVDLAAWQTSNFYIEGQLEAGRMDSSISIRGIITSVDTCMPLYYSIYRPRPSAVENVSQAGDIKLYPNPLRTSTTIQLDRSYSNAALQMYDIYGKLVKSINDISGDRVKLNRDDLSSGLYYVQLTESDRVVATKKLVVAD